MLLVHTVLLFQEVILVYNRFVKITCQFTLNNRKKLLTGIKYNTDKNLKQLNYILLSRVLGNW